MTLDQLGGQPVRLARGGTVADCDQGDLILASKIRQRGDGRVPVLARRMRVDRVGGHNLARCVYHSNFDSGAQAGVEAEGDARSGRCCKQQVMQVGGKDLDGLGFRGFTQTALEFGVQAGQEPYPPGQAHTVAQPGIGGAPLIADIKAPSDHSFGDALAYLVVRNHQLQKDNTLVACAEQGKGTVRRDGLDRLAEVEVVSEFRTFLLLAGEHAALQLCVVPQPLAHGTAEFRVLRPILHEDLPRALEHGPGIGEAGLFVQVVHGQLLGIMRGIFQDQLRQRCYPRLAGDLRLGAAFGFVWQVDVLEPGLRVSPQHRQLQFRGEFALLIDAVEHCGPPLFQFTQVDQPLLQRTQLRIVQPTCRFFTVAGDKRHGRAAVQQANRCLHLLRRRGDFCGDAFGNWRQHGWVSPDRVRCGNLHQAPLGKNLRGRVLGRRAPARRQLNVFGHREPWYCRRYRGDP